MYSIFDHDKWDYLHTWLNSISKVDCMYDYLCYRQPDLEYVEEEVSNWNSYDDRAYYIVHNDPDYVITDMECCNFELIEHTDVIDEPF